MDDYTLTQELTAEELIIAFSYIYCFIGVITFFILKIKDKDFKLKNVIEKKKLIGTLIETLGQYTYIYTFAFGEAAIASPFIASYNIVSLILSRIFLKEKLNIWQYMLIAIILVCLVLLSYS